jgi:hypothetical protein
MNSLSLSRWMLASYSWIWSAVKLTRVAQLAARVRKAPYTVVIGQRVLPALAFYVEDIEATVVNE